MLRRLRRHRSLWAAIAAGLLAAPALFSGVAAAPADANEMLPPLEPDPLATLPPDPAQLEAERLLQQELQIADLAPEEFRPLVVAAANRHQVDPRLLAAIITVESEWKPDAVGSYGELGLMQVLPSTGKWLAEVAGLTQYDLSDPETSLDFGARYIAMLMHDHGTPEKALAAYNGGPSAVDSWQTNIYARKVLKHYRKPALPTRSAHVELAS